MVIRRFPRTEDPNGALLRRDDELITLVGLRECTVGRRMLLYIDLYVVGVALTARRTIPVVSIEQVPSPGVKS